MTASSGIPAEELLSGTGNRGEAMPAIAEQAAARAALADGVRYPAILDIATISAAFPQAQEAVLMLGTNDSRQGIAPERYRDTITQVVEALERSRILVVLSTPPPLPDEQADALSAAYAVELARIARSHALPLIDYRAEILARHPAPGCFGTLIGGYDPHPSARVGRYDAGSDPFADGGDARTHVSGAAAAQVGYRLRSWLTIEKMRTIRIEIAAAGR